MLRLSNITKDYKVADTTVRALKDITLSFRENEFVSILGPSGCGKTTLLNIIGGLDKYTTGDLFIGGRSTKEFKDKDWDVYRNHRIGFIFQSYNLIPHQTVLGNVELALTIAGMSKSERIDKAKKALDKVGLKDQYYKRPNQLSGGQSQRVAIARALVNDPDILLADEPTGALDTTTSVQIMELVKEIANEKLVIMVTHNPELAEKYSTRIIKLLDGELQIDTAPFSADEEKNEVKAAKEKAARTEQAKAAAAGTDAKKKKTKTEKAKMSLLTAFRLSLQNLFTKKARTIMTSIAGSIGIIGVSLVLSISFGVQSFIGDMQNDMLSGNPIEIKKTGMNLSMLMQNTTREDKVDALKEVGFVNVDSMIEFLASRASFADNIMIDNHITQEYIDYIQTLPAEYAADIFLDYGLDITNNIFTDFKENANSKTDNMSLSAIRNIYTAVLLESPFSKYADYVTSLTDIFMQMPKNENYILTQYNLLDGHVAKDKSEIMIVLQKDSMMTDLLLAQLGYYTQEEFLNAVFKASPEEDGSPNENYNPSLDKPKFAYDELVGKSFIWYPNDDLLEPIQNTESQFHYHAYRQDSFSKGVELKIAGILEPKDDKSYGSLESGFYYTDALREHIIESNKGSRIVAALKKNGQESTSSGEQSTNGLMDGIRATADGVEKLSEGTSQLNDGLTELAKGAEQLKTSASLLTEMQSGSKQLDTGAKSLSEGLVQYTNSVDQMVEMFSLISASLEAAVRENPVLMTDPNIARLVETLRGGSAGSLGQLADASKQLREAAKQLETGTGGLNKGIQQLSKLQDGIGALSDGLAGLKGGSDGLDEGAQQLSDGLADFRTDNQNDNDSAPPISVTFTYSYNYLGEKFENVTGYLGNQSSFIAMAGSMITGNAQMSEMAKMKSLTLQQLGGINFPEGVAIYPLDFVQKDFVLEHLNRWNDDDESVTFYSESQGKTITLAADQRENIVYTDALSLIVAMINNLINIITFALIGFTSLALVVSCVMIGIITYVSVVERIKEIGVIRSLGGRKKDVSYLFNAETLIIGLISGLIGIGFTYLGSWVINLIIYQLQGINAIAIFPWHYAVIMTGVSVCLTLISGFLPSRSAAKKDPVVALRTE